MAYSEKERIKIVTDICNRVILEKISFNKAVSDSQITYVTFFNWMVKNDELKELYNYARNIRSDILFEEIIDISDKDDKDGVAFVGVNHINRDRLRIDARKWVVSKMQPKKYGDKLDVTSDNEKLNTGLTLIIGDKEIKM